MTTAHNLQQIRDAIENDLIQHIDDYLPNAQSALSLSDKSIQTTLVVSIGFSKTVKIPKASKTDPNPDPVETFQFYVNARENIPKPISRFKLDMDAHGQMRLL